jgi:hypothetical protein
MPLRYMGCILGEDKDQIDGVSSGNGALFDFVWGVGLPRPVFRGAFENRFETWCILKLFVGVRILASLERRDRMVSAKLGTHLREDCESI